MKPDMSMVFEWNSYFKRAGSRDDAAAAIAQLHSEARALLEHFKWCAEVLEEFVGFVYPGIVAVFLFRIRPAPAHRAARGQRLAGH